MKRTITAADLFCGAGGTSSGLCRAAERLDAKVQLLAINHWAIAIATHSANHPDARHLCETLDAVDPRKVCPEGLDILVASPECTHHSNARGGRPRSDQSRASAWHVVRWAEALRPRSILVENVAEFRDWGPLDDSGKAIPSKKGATYRAWLSSLRSLGYSVSDAVLCCADYGDPTTRKRLFVLARRGRRPRWPLPTHSRDGSLLGTERWRPAREVIDWDLPAPSIFDRKRPLSENTMRRIAAGLRKFSGVPFIVPNFGERDGQAPRTHSIDAPLPAVTGHGAGCLVQPFLVNLRGTAGDQLDTTALSIDAPVPALTGGNHVCLAQPFLVEYHGSHAGRDDGDRRVRSIEEPLHTQDTANRFGLCQPFIVPCNHGDDQRAHSVDEPMRTVTSVDAWGLVQPFLVNYNGTGVPHPVTEPVPTVTGNDRFGLVVPLSDGSQAVLDVGFRMLQPHELARAMSFPDGYQFAGSREQRVKQIGNAVPVMTAAVLCEALLADAS